MGRTMGWLLLKLLAMTFILADGEKTTKVRISEVAINSNGEGFIELHRQRPKDKPGRLSGNPLADYKIVIVANNPLRIIMEVDLGNEHLKLDDLEAYYTVGTAEESSSIPLNSLATFTDGVSPVFPVSMGSFVILLVTRIPGRAFGDIVMTKCRNDNRCEPRVIDDKLKDKIVRSVVDFFPVSSKKDAVSSVEFDSIFTLLPHFPLQPFSLLENHSWSYCGSSMDESDFVSYKITTTSPGSANQCTSTVASSGFATRTVQTYAAVYKEHREEALRIDQFSKVDEFIRNDLQTRIDETCRSILGTNNDLLTRSWITKWLRVEHLNGKCILSCKHCKKFQEIGFRADQQKPSKRNKFVSGFEGTTANEVSKAINEHHNCPSHGEAVLFFDDIKEASTYETKNNIFRKYETAEYAHLLPTIRMISLVMAEARTETAFNAHSVFVEAMKSVGVELGTHHGHHVAAQNILTVVGDEYHLILLRCLVKADLAFSFVVDASTDNTNNALLAIMIQTLEDEHLVMYFYRLVKLSHGESANGLFRTMEETVDSDNELVPGFLEFVRNNLIAVVSDNAPAMCSDGSSLFALLRTWTGKPLFGSRCHSHKLELAIQHASDVKKYPTMGLYSGMEKKLNRLYVYYMSRGSKKWDRFLSIAEDLNENVLRFKPYYHVRWASSHKRVIDSVTKNFNTMLPDLIAASEEDHVLLSTRTGASMAQEIYHEVTQKSFPIVLHEMVDAFAVLEHVSKALETSKSTLIGNGGIIEDSISKFNNLFSSPGPSLASFLKTCRCSKICDLGKCSLTNFQNCKTIVCNDIVFEGGNENYRLLRQTYYKNLVTEIGNYFDLEKLHTTDIFVPANFFKLGRAPSSFKEVKDFATDRRFTNFCAYLSIGAEHCKQLQLDYRPYILKVFQNPRFNALSKESNTIAFWSALLETDDTMPPIVRKTLQILLSIPSSSASCERVFSYMTRIKNKEKSLLKPEALEHLIRIKVNGPKKADGVDLFHLCRKFVERYARTDDSSYAGGRPALPEKFRGYYDDSRIF